MSILIVLVVWGALASLIVCFLTHKIKVHDKNVIDERYEFVKYSHYEIGCMGEDI